MDENIQRCEKGSALDRVAELQEMIVAVSVRERFSALRLERNELDAVIFFWRENKVLAHMPKLFHFPT